MFIGLSIVVPGLSGGTIALILRVYEKLITELAKINLNLIKKIIRLDFKGINTQLSFSFLIPITIGALIGVFFFAKIIEEFDLLGIYRPYTLSYFFGLVLGSVIYIFNILSNKKKIHFIFFLIGLIIAIIITLLPPIESNSINYFYLFFCGFIAVLGMIIPGLSGSHLLLILGIYSLIVKSVNNFLFNIEYALYLLFFFCGIIFGIISISKLIKIIFEKYRDETLVTMSGFIFGSLIFLWPITKNNDQLRTIDNLILPNISVQNLQYLCISILGLLTIILLNGFNKKNV